MLDLMHRVDVVVTDLDGTLWSGHEVVHPSTLEAWGELERRGIPVLVATGRRVGSARSGLARHGLAPMATVLNGALGVDLATDERFHRRVYEPDAAVAVLEAFRAEGVEPCVYVEHPDVEVYLDPAPSSHPGHLETLTTAQQADLAEVVATTPILMFAVMGHPPAPLDRIAAALDGIAERHVNVDQWGDHSCTITPLGISKWDGVEVCCERLGVDSTRVLALGDGPNDVELLASAAIAVVPIDADERTLAVADHVVPSAQDGGWARVLDLV
jgi:Cof subfamily protein (haloacid dehalogenase superfamily)